MDDTPATDGTVPDSQKIVECNLEEPEPMPEYVAAQSPSDPQNPIQKTSEAIASFEEEITPHKFDLDTFFKDEIK